MNDGISDKTNQNPITPQLRNLIRLQSQILDINEKSFMKLTEAIKRSEIVKTEKGIKKIVKFIKLAFRLRPQSLNILINFCNSLTLTGDSENKLALLKPFIIDSMDLSVLYIAYHEQFISLHEMMMRIIKINDPACMYWLDNDIQLGDPELAAKFMKNINQDSDDWKKRQERRRFFKNPQDLAVLLSSDSDDEFTVPEDILERPDFNPNGIIKDSIYEPCEILKHDLSYISYCSYFGSLGYCKVLAENGADPNQPDKNGMTAIHFAIAGGHFEIIQFLCYFKFKEPLNLKKTIHTAAQYHRKQILEYLIHDRCCHWNELDENNNSILHIAAIYNNVEVCNQALLAGLDINAENSQKMTPLLLAIQHQNTEVLSYMLQYQMLDLNHGIYDELPIFKAIETKNSDIVSLMIEIQNNLCENDKRHINFSVSNRFKKNLIHQAIIMREPSMVQLIVPHCSDLINDYDCEGNMPIILAIKTGKIEIVKLIAEAPNIDINKKTPNCVTAFETAISNGNIDIINYFINLPGVDLNFTDDIGFSAFHFAASINSAEVIDVLLKSGKMDPNALTPEHISPLHTAAIKGHDKTVEALLKCKDVDPNIPAIDGQLPVHMAVRSGNINCVKAFIDSGRVTLNKQSNYGDTPLIIAATDGCLEIVQYLISLGPEKVDFNLSDRFGKTAFSAACCAGRNDIVRFLLNIDGIDFEKPNIYGMSPKEQAIANRHATIVALLTK